MSTTQTRRESIQKEDTIGQVIKALEPFLTEEEHSQLTPWLLEIEMQARALIRPLKPSDTKRRHPLALASAAIYDALLTYRSRTGVMVIFSRFKTATGLSVHRIQKSWKKLFDNRSYIDIRKLNAIEVEDGSTPSTIVPVIITQIKEAVIDRSLISDDWLSCIEDETLHMLEDPSFVCDEEPIVIAAAAIYECARRHNGKKLVHLPHRHLGRICGWGEAKIARVTLDIFGKE